ncbi:MAG: hypothetical protein NTY68_02440 [Candidatus Micrarchaeota archaeon]|nr:hypothetical protein [Candidatus Micrarchaeota archaeon]
MLIDSIQGISQENREKMKGGAAKIINSFSFPKFSDDIDAIAKGHRTERMVEAWIKTRPTQPTQNPGKMKSSENASRLFDWARKNPTIGKYVPKDPYCFSDEDTAQIFQHLKNTCKRSPGSYYTQDGWHKDFENELSEVEKKAFVNPITVSGLLAFCTGLVMCYLSVFSAIRSKVAKIRKERDGVSVKDSPEKDKDPESASNFTPMWNSPEERIRGPELEVFARDMPKEYVSIETLCGKEDLIREALSMEDALRKADEAGRVIASNKKISKYSWWMGNMGHETKEGRNILNCWTGTMAAYDKPDQKIGNTIEYVDPTTDFERKYPDWRYLLRKEKNVGLIVIAHRNGYDSFLDKGRIIAFHVPPLCMKGVIVESAEK